MIKPSQEKFVYCLFFFVFSLFLFTKNLSQIGFEYRDDEVFYLKSTQEMLSTHNYLSPTYFGEDRFQKPILFYWFILLFYKIFGVSWFAARFISSLSAAVIVPLVWSMARDHFGKSVAHLSALILITSPLFFRHAKNAVPDMLLNLFIVLSFYCLDRYIRVSALPDKDNRRMRDILSISFFACCGLGFMVKGFTAVIIPVVSFIAYCLLINRPKLLSQINFSRGMIVFLIIGLPWFVMMGMKHGASYFHYMVAEETAKRVVVEEGSPFFLVPKYFISHVPIYLRYISSYFAPWGALALFAIVVFLKKGEFSRNKKLTFLGIWFGVVFLFFSSLYFVINHYMLALSVPLAVLTAYFLLSEEMSWPHPWVIDFLRKYIILFFVLAGAGVLSFILFFMAGIHWFWLLPILASVLTASIMILRTRNLMTAPLILSILIVFVLFQMPLLEKEGLTAHESLRQFAEVINKDGSRDFEVATASHDIHEKEWQIYLGYKIEKLANEDDNYNVSEVPKFLNRHPKIYCLITQKDFDGYFRTLERKDFVIVKEQYVVRKRFYLDKGFLEAVLCLDQGKAFPYLMEKVFLLKKDLNGSI